MKSICIIAAVALVALAGGARAQAPIIAKKTLTLEGAKQVVETAKAFIKKNNTTGVVAVVDDGGNLICLERIDNTFPAGANISIGKARTAALFKRPTKVFEEIIKNGRTPMIALHDFTPLQGGVPILVDGQIIGAIGVSGAANADQDEEIAEIGARALAAGKADAAPVPVTYFDKEKVAAAFARGAVLFDGSDGRNYMVHASRRDKPGLVEVHTLDADVIYVLGGEATFITGGTMVDGKEIAPNEIRGRTILGGDTRHLVKGDVIIVPRGTPHWFQEIKGTFTYFVVKVR